MCALRASVLESAPRKPARDMQGNKQLSEQT